MIRAADAEGRHLVKKKVRPVLDSKRDQDIRLRRLEQGSKLVVAAEYLFSLFLWRRFGPSRHSRRMAGSASEYDGHGSLQSCQSLGIILVRNAMKQRERSKQQRMHAKGI